jgi:hypothetical protein
MTTGLKDSEFAACRRPGMRETGLTIRLGSAGTFVNKRCPTSPDGGTLLFP